MGHSGTPVLLLLPLWFQGENAKRTNNQMNVLICKQNRFPVHTEVCSIKKYKGMKLYKLTNGNEICWNLKAQEYPKHNFTGL